MSDVFISYARSTAAQAQQVAAALRGAGYSVWIDDDLPAHRTYSRVIEEQMTAAKAAVVIWSADAAQSEWVLSEANRAREDRKLVQVVTDTARLPMPFDTIQCADLNGWTGDVEAAGWRKVLASVGHLVGAQPAPTSALPPIAPPLPSKPSIAVLPFANLSGDAEQDYFADGMVVEIIEALSRVRSIFVIASGSTLSFRGKDIGAQEAARRLGVRYVLEGSVRKAGGRVRVGLQLIDAADGAQIWTHRFEDTLEDVFALQDRVALAVASRIEPTVTEAEILRASARPTDNMSSYDLYLRALPLYRSVARPGVLQALEFLDRAIALDPGYASALALAALCHQFVQLNGWSDDSEGHRRQGVDLAHRALGATGDDATVIANSAYVIAISEGDIPAGLTLFDRAIRLNPGSSRAWMLSGATRARAGDAEVAIEHIEMAIRLDPMSPSHTPLPILFMGVARFEKGQFVEAAAHLTDFCRQRETPFALTVLAACHGHLGQTSAGLAVLGRLRTLTPLPVDELVPNFLQNLAHRKLLLDGVALAEGRTPADAETGAPP